MPKIQVFQNFFFLLSFLKIATTTTYIKQFWYKRWIWLQCVYKRKELKFHDQWCVLKVWAKKIYYQLCFLFEKKQQLSIWNYNKMFPNVEEPSVIKMSWSFFHLRDHHWRGKERSKTSTSTFQHWVKLFFFFILRGENF